MTERRQARREGQAVRAVAQVERLGITGTTYDGFGDVDFVIEAVPEEMELKHEVFAELDACTPGHAILASTTSGLSITEIGEITMRPDQVVGFHFRPGSRLIEMIEGDDTSPETVQAAANFAHGAPQDAGPGGGVSRFRRRPGLAGAGSA